MSTTLALASRDATSVLRRSSATYSLATAAKIESRAFPFTLAVLAIVEEEMKRGSRERAAKDSDRIQMKCECEGFLSEVEQRAPRTSARQVPKQLAVGDRVHRANMGKDRRRSGGSVS